MSVNSKMTAIADGIRALNGGTAALGLDAIATALDVEKTNVDAALAALAEKGVTVPTGSKSDALAGLIAAIEAGGGGSGVNGLDFGYEIVTGSYTPASDTQGSSGTAMIGYDKNKGNIRLALIWCRELINSQITPTKAAILAGIQIQADSSNGLIGANETATKASAWVYMTTGNSVLGKYFASEGDPKQYISIYAASQYYLAGYTYDWITWRDKV